MGRYVLTNYAIGCKDVESGKTGCFIFDLGRYEMEGVFYAITPVYKDLQELYDKTDSADRRSCYVEYKGGTDKWMRCLSCGTLTTYKPERMSYICEGCIDYLDKCPDPYDYQGELPQYYEEEGK